MKFRSLMVTTVIAGALLTCVPAAHADYRTTFQGAWSCTDRGSTSALEGARVELWQRGEDWLPKWLTDSQIAVHHSGGDGGYAFGTRSGGKDDFYIRLSLADDDGVRLEDWWSPWAWYIDTPTNLNNVPVQDYGNRAIQADGGRSTAKCAIWQGLRSAYTDYRGVYGKRPPQGNQTVQADAPSGGVPFTVHTKMFWPPGAATGPKPGQITTSFHEFAHTFRHGFDGSLLHFLGDSIDYKYAQQHEACKKTNPGFAFNEGWAEYWARTYPGGLPGLKKSGCPGASPTDASIEGNVAVALANLEEGCLNVSRRDLVETLARSGSAIHTLDQFKGRLTALKGPCAPGIAEQAASFGGIHDHKADWRSRVGTVRQEFGGLSKQVRGLRQELGLALRQSKRPFPCKLKPCLEALKRKMHPDIVRGEIAQAKFLRRSLGFMTSKKAVRRLGSPRGPKYFKRLRTKEKQIVRGLAKVERLWLRRAVQRGRPILRKDHSPVMKRLGRRFSQALATLGRGRLPIGFHPPSPIVEALRTLPTPTPAPAPAPAPAPRQPASLTLGCPSGYTVPGGTATFSGTLSPPHPGSHVTVTYRIPSSEAVQDHAATVGADGSWSDSYLTSDTDQGSNTVQAHWPGDADHQPADSPVCSFNVHYP